MELIKSFYELAISKEVNVYVSEITKNFNNFEFLHILYRLMLCESHVLKQSSLEMILVKYYIIRLINYLHS